MKKDKIDDNSTCLVCGKKPGLDEPCVRVILHTHGKTEGIWCTQHFEKICDDYTTKYDQKEWLKNYGFPIIGITVGIIASTFAILAYINTV